MKNLITSAQETKLTTMLENQRISINNIEIHFDEVIQITVEKNRELFRPFEDTHSIKRKFNNFNDWWKWVKSC